MSEREEIPQDTSVHEEVERGPQLATEQDVEPNTSLSRVTWRDEATKTVYAERVYGLNQRGHLVDRYRVAADAPESLIPAVFRRRETQERMVEPEDRVEQPPVLQRAETEIIDMALRVGRSFRPAEFTINERYQDATSELFTYLFYLSTKLSQRELTDTEKTELYRDAYSIALSRSMGFGKHEPNASITIKVFTKESGSLTEERTVPVSAILTAEELSEGKEIIAGKEYAEDRGKESTEASMVWALDTARTFIPLEEPLERNREAIDKYFTWILYQHRLATGQDLTKRQLQYAFNRAQSMVTQTTFSRDPMMELDNVPVFQGLSPNKAEEGDDIKSSGWTKLLQSGMLPRLREPLRLNPMALEGYVRDAGGAEKFRNELASRHQAAERYQQQKIAERDRQHEAALSSIERRHELKEQEKSSEGQRLEWAKERLDMVRDINAKVRQKTAELLGRSLPDDVLQLTSEQEERALESLANRTYKESQEQATGPATLPVFPYRNSEVAWGVVVNRLYTNDEYSALKSERGDLGLEDLRWEHEPLSVVYGSDEQYERSDREFGLRVADRLIEEYQSKLHVLTRHVVEERIWNVLRPPDEEPVGYVDRTPSSDPVRQQTLREHDAFIQSVYQRIKERTGLDLAPESAPV